MSGGRRRPYFVVEWSGGGGLGHYAFLLADAMDRVRPQVTLLTRDEHELRSLKHGMSIDTLWRAAPPGASGVGRKIRVGSARAAGWFRLVARARRTRREGAVFHFQSLEFPIEALAALCVRGLGGMVVLTLHNVRRHDASLVTRATRRVALRIPSAFVVHNDDAAREVRRLIRPSARIRIIAHPSFRPILDVAPPTSRQRKRRPRVSCLGMLWPYKGLELVVEAFTKATRSGAVCELRVAGRPTDRRAIEAILRGAPADRLSHRLTYLELPDLVREVHETDVLLLGHRSRSASGIAQLALAAGVPVVAPATGVFPTLLSKRPDWLFTPDDADDAARRLGDVLKDLELDPAGVDADAKGIDAATPSWDDMAAVCSRLADELLPDAGEAVG